MAHEVICPHRQKAFTIDGAGYAEILRQVRNSEFEKEMLERLELAEKDKLKAIELVEAKAAVSHGDPRLTAKRLCNRRMSQILRMDTLSCGIASLLQKSRDRFRKEGPGSVP